MKLLLIALTRLGLILLVPGNQTSGSEINFFIRAPSGNWAFFSVVRRKSVCQRLSIKFNMKSCRTLLKNDGKSKTYV